jgi:hypothetical protein
MEKAERQVRGSCGGARQNPPPPPPPPFLSTSSSSSSYPPHPSDMCVMCVPMCEPRKTSQISHSQSEQGQMLRRKSTSCGPRSCFSNIHTFTNNNIGRSRTRALVMSPTQPGQQRLQVAQLHRGPTPYADTSGRIPVRRHVTSHSLLIQQLQKHLELGRGEVCDHAD